MAKAVTIGLDCAWELLKKLLDSTPGFPKHMRHETAAVLNLVTRAQEALEQPKPLTGDEHGHVVFMKLRREEFANLWDEFRQAGGSIDDETVRQVLNGLPIEALRDWKRARSS